MLNNDANIVNMALKISLILSYTAGMSSQNSKTWGGGACALSD